MGSIKDNFSQAVKELWKKDGAEEVPEIPAPPEGTPTQLDQYLAQQEDDIPDMPMQPETLMQGQDIPTVSAAQAQPAAPVNSGMDHTDAGVPLETPYYRPQPDPAQVQAAQAAAQAAQAAAQAAQAAQQAVQAMPGVQPNVNQGGFGGGASIPPAAGNANANRAAGITEEVTVISRNTVIDGNVRSLANMQVDGNIKGNVETTRDIEMTGKVVGDIQCNNANMSSAAMQGNLTIKGKMRMDRDTILIGDLTSQYADVNGRVRGKLEIGGKAELKRDAIVFGDINASTIAVTDGAIIQGYVNTTFLSKDDSRNVFPDVISLDTSKEMNAK